MTKSFSHACHCIYRSSTPDKALFPASNAQVIVLPCGTVTWLPFVTIRSRCPMRKRPMKGHVECSIKIGSWVYSGRFVSINLKRKEIDANESPAVNPGADLDGAFHVALHRPLAHRTSASDGDEGKPRHRTTGQHNYLRVGGGKQGFVRGAGTVNTMTCMTK
ncbi:neuronal acetylcholine receptor subunit alpha-7 [Caerostris darwini]|uniref:Neuronal acetylcholine receptor subunit alpha-7 n=1 Tax=Caerostris darwini TaxID=1538125 RepID=A0AAV4RSV8_9ARAC|nr:neuronal acetylcholine receptor subunit alpha-7 [Caerostris darwini]